MVKLKEVQSNSVNMYVITSVSITLWSIIFYWYTNNWPSIRYRSISDHTFPHSANITKFHSTFTNRGVGLFSGVSLRRTPTQQKRLCDNKAARDNAFIPCWLKTMYIPADLSHCRGKRPLLTWSAHIKLPILQINIYSRCYLQCQAHRTDYYIYSLSQLVTNTSAAATLWQNKAKSIILSTVTVTWWELVYREQTEKTCKLHTEKPENVFVEYENVLFFCIFCINH